MPTPLAQPGDPHDGDQLRSACAGGSSTFPSVITPRQSAGALQTKVLRDVESVEQPQPASCSMGGRLACLVNIVFALAITRPAAAVVFWLYKKIPRQSTLRRRASSMPCRRRSPASNAAFREEIERMSTRVVR